MDASLLELVSSAPPGVRHMILCAKTIACFVRLRPRLVFAQNPSMLLATVAVVWGRITGATIVVDRHTYYFRGVSNDAGRWWAPLGYLMARFTTKFADLTLVTNKDLARAVELQGGRPFVLPDRIPRFPTATSAQLQLPSPTVFVISTFARDEPISEVIEAAKTLSGVTFRISGSTKKAYTRLSDLSKLPDNVRLTGYLPDDQYLQALTAANAVVVLTTLQNCLNCGAYESVALGKAMVLSNTSAIREYFSRGATYADPTAGSIATAISGALENQLSFEHDTTSLRSELVSDWHERLARLRKLLNLSQSTIVEGCCSDTSQPRA